MPATPADIAAGMREAVTVSWSDTAIHARYPSARDGLDQPAEGFFDSDDDAQAAMNARGALLGVDRRRWSAPAHALVWPDLTAGLPIVRLVAAEHNVDTPTIAARIELNLDAETTSYELFG